MNKEDNSLLVLSAVVTIYICIGLMFQLAFAADNEIWMDQSGATASIDLEQQGGSNLIGGVGSVPEH